MPPKPKFTREEIVAAALDIVAAQGPSALTAKALGDALGSSARPIFTVFDSMAQVREAVREAAMARFEGYAAHELPDMPRFKQVGMQMLRFAAREPKLYQLLFMTERDAADGIASLLDSLGDTARQCIEALERDYALAPEAAERVFENVWVYTFGVGALCATGACRFSEEQLGQMLTTEFQAMLAYVRSEET